MATVQTGNKQATSEPRKWLKIWFSGLLFLVWYSLLPCVVSGIYLKKKITQLSADLNEIFCTC